MTNRFDSFDDVIRSIRSASSKEEVDALVDQVDAEFAADTLQVTPENWGALASAVLMRADELSLLSSSSN